MGGWAVDHRQVSLEMVQKFTSVRGTCFVRKVFIYVLVDLVIRLVVVVSIALNTDNFRKW